MLNTADAGWAASRQAAIAALAALAAGGACWCYFGPSAGRRNGSGGGGADPRSPTDFGAFLKARGPELSAPGGGRGGGGGRNPTDFGSFLKGSRAASRGAAEQQQHQAEKQQVVMQHGPDDGDAVVTVLYGTEYGFSKEVADKLCERLRQLRSVKLWPRLLDMADHPAGLPQLCQEQLLLLVCSTQGDGVPPSEAREFIDWLNSSGAPRLDGVRFSVCALGDRSYQHYCRCGKVLDARLAALGGERVAPRADINREDWAAIERWVGQVEDLAPALGLETLAERGGLDTSAQGAQEERPPVRRWTKSRPYPARVVAVEPLCTLHDKDDKDTVRVELDLGDSGLTYTPGDALGIYPTNSPAAVADLLRALGLQGGEQVEPPAWMHHALAPADEEGGRVPGQLPHDGRRMAVRDALTACYDLRTPKPELLQLLLDMHHAAGSRDRHVNGHANGLASKPTNGYVNGDANGRTNGLATNPTSGHANGDANSHAGGGSPSPAEGLALLRALAADPKALQSYLDTEGRHVVDILTDSAAPGFLLPAPPTTTATATATAAVEAERKGRQGQGEGSGVVLEATQRVLACLRPLAPRLYSISSSPLEGEAAGGSGQQGGGAGPKEEEASSSPPPPRRVQATVALVKYKFRGRHREGVASTFCGERIKPGDLVPIYISPNPDFRLPRDPATPIIMVGPGTGLAPFRAFLQHRQLEAAAAAQQGGHAKQGTAGTAVLYFGCRRRDQDYLYGELLEGWAATGALQLHTAFSREQPGRKVYVQQRLAETGEKLWQLLRKGAHFYVCGDASSMAGAVEEALLALVQEHMPCDRQAAEGFLDGMRATHRYQRDIW